MDRLRQLIEAKNLGFRRRFVGRELPAVTLHSPPGQQGGSRALSDNFLELGLDTPLAANRDVRVVVTGTGFPGDSGRMPCRLAS